MKYLILNLLVLLPSVVLGINTVSTSTENNWEQDESFTLSTPSKEENAPIMNHGPVEVSLSGPFDKSTVSTALTDNGSSTTVDPIMSLIIKTLLEDRFNNELNPEASSNKTRNNSTPLSYMTPPPIPINKEAGSTKSSSSEEFDDATSTTTMTNDETSTATDSSENDESVESSSSTPAIIMTQNFDTKGIPSSNFNYDSQQKEQNEGEYFVSSTTSKSLTIEQYAERYQDYFPQVSSEKSTAFDNVPPEEAPYENDDSESVTPNNNLQPPHANNQMDQVTFDNPRSQTDQEQDVTPNQPKSENDQSTNNFMTTNESPPIYYFFLRPRVLSSQRNSQSPFMMSSMSQPYSEATDPWRQYPERRLSLARLPFIAQDYDSQQVATQASSNMPYRYPTLSNMPYNNNYYNSYPSYPQYNYNQQFQQTQFMPRPYFPQMQNDFQTPMMATSPYSSRPYYNTNNNYFRTIPYYNYNTQYRNMAYPQQTPFIGMTN